MKNIYFFLVLVVFLDGCFNGGVSYKIDKQIRIYKTPVKKESILILPPSLNFKPPGVKKVYKYGFTFMEGIKNGLLKANVKAGELSELLTYSFYKNNLDRWEGNVVDDIYDNLRKKNLLSTAIVKKVPSASFSYNFIDHLRVFSQISLLPIMTRREFTFVDEMILILKRYRLIILDHLYCPYEIMNRYRVNFSFALIDLKGGIKGFLLGSYTGNSSSSVNGDYLFAAKIGRLMGQKLFY